MAEDEVRESTGGWRWPLGPIRILIIATALLSIVFLLVPNLDLWFSRQFYDPEIGFPALRIPALHWLRDVSGLLLWVAGGVVGLSLLLKLLVFPRRPPFVPGRAMLFLSATLALSAGLLVNGILKSLWGRPRPTQVLEFGGDAPFVTAWHISDFCARNCSFVSGEAAAAIWLVAIVLVVPARFRRAALAAAVALAFAFSLNRIAFGGHFLSDVLLAWTLTLLVIAIAWHFIYVRPPRFFEEAAIDGALTRAGLWLRGLVARRKTGEPAPLHPEEAAVLAAETVAPAPGPREAPRGPAAAGHGFAGSVDQGDEPEDAPERGAVDLDWAEDIHRDVEPAGEAPDIAASTAMFPPPAHDEPEAGEPRDDAHIRAAEAAVRDAVEAGPDHDDHPIAPVERAEAAAPEATPPPAAPAADIESIDPKPEETSSAEIAEADAPRSGPPDTASAAPAPAPPAADAPPPPADGGDGPGTPVAEPPSADSLPDTPAATAEGDAPGTTPDAPRPRPALLELPPPDRS